MLNTVHEHHRLASLLPNLVAIEHYRVVDEYRDDDWYGPGFCHVGVAIMDDGSCFVQRVRMSRHRYVRKIWFRKSVGQALKRAVDARLYNELEPDFTINPNLNVKERDVAIREALNIARADDGRNWFVDVPAHYIVY